MIWGGADVTIIEIKCTMSCAWIILKPSPHSWFIEKMSSTKLPWGQKCWGPLLVIICICTFLQISLPQLCKVIHGVVEHCLSILEALLFSGRTMRDILKLSEILIKGLIATCMLSCSVMSDSLQPSGLQPAKLLCPGNSPGKNYGVGFHFLLQGILTTSKSYWSLLQVSYFAPGILYCWATGTWLNLYSGSSLNLIFILEPFPTWPKFGSLEKLKELFCLSSPRLEIPEMTSFADSCLISLSPVVSYSQWKQASWYLFFLEIYFRFTSSFYTFSFLHLIAWNVQLASILFIQ